MIKTISTFLKNIGFNMIANFSNRLVNAVLILLISHFLGVTAMGSYSVAHTYYSFGLLISYWGFGNLLTREVARDRNAYSKYLSNFGVLRLIFGVVVILAINLIAHQIDYSAQTQTTIQIISIAILANTILNLIFALFIAFEELKYLSAVSLSISVLRLIASYLILKFGGSVMTIAIFFTATEFLSLLFSVVFAVRFLKVFHFSFSLDFSLRQIVRAFPFFWIAILVILDSQVEILIISLFFNEDYVGYYTAMNTIIGGVALFSEAIRNAVFPIFARYQHQAPDRLEEMLQLLAKYILLITVPVTMGVYFFAGEIIALFFRPGYEISATLLQIVIWTFIGYSLTVVAIRLLMVHDKEKRVVLSLFISGILTIVLNYFIAPVHGLVGVAAVRLMTSYVLFFLCLFFLHRQGYKIIKPSVALRILIASGILFGTAFLLHSRHPYLGLFAGYLLFAGTIWFTKILTPNDLQLWKNVFQNIFNPTSGEKNQA